MTSAPASLPPDLAPPSPRESFLTRVRLLLRPSNFIAAIPGPIFHKDVWISGRKSGTYWIRFIYVIMLLITIAIVFAGNVDDLSDSSPTLRLQQLQQISPFVTKTLLWFQFITLGIIGTILGAPAICEEKRAGTLGTLLTTPLKAWQIVVGKACAFFVQLMILAFVAAPLMLAVRVFGGVAAKEILTGTVLILSTALLGGLCALLFSVTMRRTAGAIMGGLLLLVFIQGVVPLSWALYSAYASYYRTPMLPEWLLVNASTPAALGIVTFGFTAPPSMQNAWIYSTLYTLAASGLIIIFASWQLRTVMAREGEGGSAIPAGKKSRPRKSKSTPTTPTPEAEEASPDLLLPNVKRRRRASTVQEGATRVVGDHPVFWREMRQAIFRSHWPVIILLVGVCAILGAVYYFGGLDESVAHTFIAVVAAVLTLLSAAVTPASIISGERESRTMDVLLTTPLTARAIILGKAAGAARRQWILPALLSAHLVIAMFARLYYGHTTMSPLAIFWVLLLLIPPVLFLTATGTLMSLICKKSSGASAANFGIALALWLIIPGLISIVFGWLLRGFRGSDDWLSWLWSINPLATFGSAIEGAASGSYRLMSIRLDAAGMFLVALFFAVVYTGGAALVLQWTASILALRTARLK